MHDRTPIVCSRFSQHFMMQSLSQFLCFALVSGLFLTACNVTSNSSTSTTPAIVEATKAPVTTASRVIALTSLSADIVQRLDQTKLIGMGGSRLLNQKPEFAKIPKVSEGRTQPNLEKIVALKPDLVIGATGFHDQTLAKLKEMGVQTLATEVNSWRSLEDLTRELATKIQADPNPLLRSYQACFQPKPAQTASTLILASSQPILAPNKNSWAGDLLTQFQVKNVVADLQGQSPISGYVTLSPEKVLQTDPEVVILVDAEEGQAAKLKTAPFWNQLQATKSNRVYMFEYYGLVNPGSIDAINKACTQLKQVFTQ